MLMEIQGGGGFQKPNYWTEAKPEYFWGGGERGVWILSWTTQSGPWQEATNKQQCKEMIDNSAQFRWA